MGVSADVDELLALARSAADAADDLGDLAGVNAEAAEGVLGVVVVPRRTGRLASTLAAESDALGFTLTAGGPTAPYGPYVHARDPFLTRALAERETALADAYEQHAEQALDNL